MNVMARRGQTTGGSGQRVNTGTWSGKYGGGGKWGGQANNSGWTNNNNDMTRQPNNRQFNASGPDGAGHGGNPMYQRGHPGKFTQGPVQQWGRQNNMGSGGGGRQGQGHNMRAGNTSQRHQGGQGQGRVMGQGDLRITVDHQPADLQGQGQPRQGLKDMTFDQKRRKAMQALREARKTIAQLDQQSAREQMVNSRRGIAPQSPGSSYQTTHDDDYGGTISDFSESSSSSESDMEDQPIMSKFKVASPASRSSSSSSSRHKRWQHKASEGDHCDSTLTISIDNSTPFVSHSQRTPTKNPNNALSPHHSHSTQHRSKQHWGQSPRRRKQQQHYHHHHHQPEHDLPQAHSPQSPQPQPQHFPPRQHNTHQQWHPQEETRLVDTVEMRRGASPGFSQQLAHLKPTVAMTYAFQKKTFSAASTPVSLNARFSEPDDPAGRKVFM